MKRILATTALALVMTGGAITGGVLAAELNTYQSQPSDIRASQFIGQRIYATDNMPATDSVKAGAEKDWDDVGEINEVILDPNGSVKAVVLGVGGFLGMGEKNVAIALNDVKFVKNGDSPDDYFLVVNANKEQLAAAPAFMTAEEKQAAAENAAQTNDAMAPADTAANTTTMPTDNAADTAATTTTPADTTASTTMKSGSATTDDTAANTTTGTTAKPADQTAMDTTTSTDTTTTGSTTTATPADDARTRLVRPEITREGYTSVQIEELTADKLEGATVYGPKDENVGEINRIILSNDGKKIDRVVLDVGGFLGMGERQIAVTMDELNIVRNADGTDFRVYIDANQANLKAQPEFKG